ncbi:hypothetical protein HanRHA438_Chr15g0703951 [Helianthus annuus]|nr:hypothetical protein HanRHA438_Chr15g0703951 [Helianthus annuus]
MLFVGLKPKTSPSQTQVFKGFAFANGPPPHWYLNRVLIDLYTIKNLTLQKNKKI